MSKILLSITIWLCTLCVPTTPSVSDEPCDDLAIETVDNTTTISNIKAAHTNMEVYKVRGDGGWTQVFSCNDNCGEQVTFKVEPATPYLVHVKMFDANWAKVCDKQINYKSHGEAQNTEGGPSCDNVTVAIQDGTMTVSNIKAPHSHVDIYKVRADSGWDKVSECNDNCKETITTEVDAKQKYIVHVKLFSEAWGVICDKQIEYNPQ
jgi:hypothetical protein